MARKSEASNPARYLILGAAGQLGMGLVTRLGETGVPKAKESLSIRDTKKLTGAIVSMKPDVVINAACVSSSRPKDFESMWEVNAHSIGPLAEICMKAGVPLMHISCASVFGKHRSPLSLTEKQTPRPTCALGVSKLCGEHALLEAAANASPKALGSGFRWWIVRLGWLFEKPFRSRLNVSNAFLTEASARTKVTVPEALPASYAYVPHVTKALRHMLSLRQSLPSGTYHLANQGYAAPRQFAEELYAACGIKATVNETTGSAHALQTLGFSCPPISAVLDSKYFAQRTGYPLLPDWREAVQEFGAAYKAEK